MERQRPLRHRWTPDGRLTEKASEQRTISLVHELRADGLSYRAIVDELRRRRRVNRAGKPFILPQVQRILRRAAGR